jgi:hypothetical protein
MKSRVVLRSIYLSIFFFAVAASIGIRPSARSATPPLLSAKRPSDRLVVHEWGTFTSTAGKDGVALEWRPLNGPSDLPKFVYTMQQGERGLRNRNTPPGKGEIRASVRMETPVLYFYADKEMEVSAKVGFPKGKITEWYPQARSAEGGIDWGKFKVIPGGKFTFPVETGDSHYYPARETDAAPVQVCGSNEKPLQQEKFLFYRGVGTFDLPLSVKLEAGNVQLKNLGTDQITHLIIFENRSGKIGYRLCDAFTGEMSHERPALDRNLESLLLDLKQILVVSGLYEREAEAMIKTWRDSWFEEGLRVFYILPRTATDGVLPVTIEPAPTELVRVLVGRAEVITPEMESAVQRQVKLLENSSREVRADAIATIREYGRFSEPILKRLLLTESDRAARRRIRKLIDAG